MTYPITILVATHGRPDLLERTLRYLAACELPEEYAGIIIVENGGRFGAQPVVENAPPPLRARYLYQELGNKSRALNLAMADLTGAALFIDDDVRVNPNFLMCYAHILRTAPLNKFYYGGPIEVDYEEAPPEWLKKYLPFSAVGWRPTSEQITSQDFYFLGANWCALIDDLKAIGGFVEWAGPGTALRGQEWQMQHQMMKAGLRPVYLSEPVVWHYVPKENCTPDWALQRAEKVAIHQGLYYEDSAPKLWGFPRWMYFAMVKHYAHNYWARLFERDPEKRHQIARELYVLRGIFKGIRGHQKGLNSNPAAAKH
ncbi:MAG: glycosyltransferase [Planctomycetota bacterium]